MVVMAKTIEKMEIMNVAQELHPVLSLKETAILMNIAKMALSVGRTIALLILAHQELIVANHLTVLIINILQVNTKIWFYQQVPLFLMAFPTTLLPKYPLV